MSAFPIPSPPVSVNPVICGPSLVKARAAASGLRATAEMLALPARWLVSLPAPPTFRLHVTGTDGVVRVDLQGEAANSSDVVFSDAEWVALCRGIEADRIWPADLVELCARKRANPAHRLELQEALAGVQVDESELWTLGRLLERVDAHLVSV